MDFALKRSAYDHQLFGKFQEKQISPKSLFFEAFSGGECEV